MNSVKRYAIKMRNGNYMRQEFTNSMNELELKTSDLPIDADLFKEKWVAQKVLIDMLEKNWTPIPVTFDEDNPPADVVEVDIDFAILQLSKL